MIPIQGLVGANPIDVAYGALRWRADALQGESAAFLAPRITASTPGAVPCPACFDTIRMQATVPEDPTCLGGGYVIPGPTGVDDPATQRGYLDAVPIEAVVSMQRTRTRLEEIGYLEATEALLLWPEQEVTPKESDLIIAVDPLQAPVSQRYLVGDETDPEVLGATVLVHRNVLALLRREHPAYRAQPPDPTAATPGTWT